MKENKPILLVEDDEVDIMTIKRVLRRLEVTNQLVVCGNGEEALSWLRNNMEKKPGLILLDLNMPRMSGLEFLKTIKNNDDLCMIPVVVLTTSSDPFDRKESFKNNAAGYMLKSINHADFLHTVEHIRDYWKQSELAY